VAAHTACRRCTGQRAAVPFVETGCKALRATRLVNRIAQDSALREVAFGLAKSPAKGPAVALGFLKDNLDQALTSDFLSLLDQEADRTVRSAKTLDHKEAVRAVERRRPAFHGA
jgi:hypothetical protein